MRIALASDHAGFSLKEEVKAFLAGHELTDFGADDEQPCDLSDHVYPAALAVSDGRVERAILVDGVGYGSAMIANKLVGVFAAVCQDPFCATLARLAVRQPQRRLPVDWGDASGLHDVDVQVLALDRKWLLKEVTNAIAQANAHVGEIRSDAERGSGRVRLRLRLRIGDYGQLSALLAKLAALPGVEEARRT